jgi:hypothetical protein
MDVCMDVCMDVYMYGCMYYVCSMYVCMYVCMYIVKDECLSRCDMLCVIEGVKCHLFGFFIVDDEFTYSLMLLSLHSMRFKHVTCWCFVLSFCCINKLCNSRQPQLDRAHHCQLDRHCGLRCSPAHQYVVCVCASICVCSYMYVCAYIYWCEYDSLCSIS